MRAGIATVLVSPALGVGFTMLGMARAFHELGQTPAVGDPSHLSKPMGDVLMASAIGVPLGLAGLITAIVARQKFKGLEGDHAAS